MIRLFIILTSLAAIAACTNPAPSKNSAFSGKPELPDYYLGEWTQHKCASLKISREDHIPVATPSFVDCEVTRDEKGNETWYNKEKIHVLSIDGDTVYALGEIIPNYKLKENLPASKHPIIYHRLELSYEILERDYLISKKARSMTIIHRVCLPPEKFIKYAALTKPDYQAIFDLCKPEPPEKMQIGFYYQSFQ